jgi:DNA-binding winged helix-turn-helix (wHTH) protein
MSKIEKKSRSRKTLDFRMRLLEAAMILAFIMAGILAVALLAHWLDLWGSDVQRIEIALSEGVFFWLATSVIIGLVLRRSLAVERKSTNLEQKTERLKQTMTRHLARYQLHIEGEKAFQGAKELRLTPHEFALLKCLMEKESELCEYEYIFEQVWPQDQEAVGDKDRLTALVRRLRGKLIIPYDYLRNHVGRGYEFIQWAG